MNISIWNMKQNDDELMILSLWSKSCVAQLVSYTSQWKKLQCSSFLTKVFCSPLVSAFWQIFTIKNNVEWKPCSHVEASLQKVNVIIQVLVQKGPYNVRMTTTMKFVSPSSSKSWCYLYDSFVHSQKKKYNLEIKLDVIKSFPKQNIKHKTLRFINLI